MKPRNKAVEELSAGGYALKRKGANHDIYYNAKTGCIIPLKRRDFDEDDLRYIKRKSGKIRKNGTDKGGTFYEIRLHRRVHAQ